MGASLNLVFPKSQPPLQIVVHLLPLPPGEVLILPGRCRVRGRPAHDRRRVAGNHLAGQQFGGGGIADDPVHNEEQKVFIGLKAH